MPQLHQTVEEEKVADGADAVKLIVIGFGYQWN
jgi:hypothetical protein